MVKNKGNKNMHDLWEYLKVTEKPIFLYGTGNGADKILDELTRLGIQVEGVFASDGFVRNRTFRGFKVQSYSDVKAKYGGDIIVLVSFGTSLPDVINNIKRIALETELYAPDVPVIPDGTIFNLQYAKEHKSELQLAYSCLSDELSKKVFENTVMYKLTGKIQYLLECESEQSEIFDKLGIASTETFIDLGAYNGDTVLEFVSINPDYKRIYAIEPDAKNFRKLTVNTSEIENLILINSAVGKKDGKVHFKMSGGRNSATDKNGKEIEQICVDSLNAKGKVYIKLDVEGAEENAISGSLNTIKNFKPILNIAAYHKNSDIFSIPILVKKLNPDYNVFIRHHSYIPAWDTNYYFLVGDKIVK